MTKRLLPLFVLLAACAQPEDMLSDSMGAPAPMAEPVMVEEAAAVLKHSDVNAQECSGDGIGGTGCPAN